jgi:hypothetical protein
LSPPALSVSPPLPAAVSPPPLGGGIAFPAPAVINRESSKQRVNAAARLFDSA